jgi:tetratricopeptide (TPR) repeat protein
MFCSNCGKKLAVGSKFCPGCGTKVGNISNHQENEDLEDDTSEYEDDDIEEDDEDVDIEDFLNEDNEDDEDEDESFDNKNFINSLNSLAAMSLKMDCIDMDSSYDDIMNTVGSKLFLSAQQCFNKKQYDKAAEYFKEYIKINDNLISRYRFAQSLILLASLQTDNDMYKDNFLDLIENALNISNNMYPTKNPGKFKLFKLKGHALSLQANYFKFLKKVSKDNGKEEEVAYKASTLDAIKSFREAINFANSEASKSEEWLRIGKLYCNISNVKEALDCFKKCTVGDENIDISTYFRIWCYVELKDYRNTAIMLSKYLKNHKDEDVNEIDEDLLKLKTAIIEKGYGDYFK